MRTLVRNRRLTILIRIVLSTVLLLLVAALAIRLHGKANLDKAYKAAESAWRSEAPSRPATSLGEKDAIVWLAAGARAAVIEGDARYALADLASALKQPELSTAQISQAEMLLDTNAPAITLLHRAEGLQALINPSSEFEEFDIVRALYASRLLALEARLSCRKGDWNRFFSSVRLLSIWTKALESDPASLMLPTPLWLGAASEGLLIGTLREAAQNPALPRSMAINLPGLVPEADLLMPWRAFLHGQVNVAEDPYHNPVDAKVLWPEITRPEAFLDNLLLGDSIHANFVEYNARLAMASMKPYARDKEDIPDGFSVPSLRGTTWIPNGYLKGSLARLQATLAQRQLARTALTALSARQSPSHWPKASALPLGPDSFTGNPLSYEIMPDGALRLSCPGLAELYAASPRNSGIKIADTWTLPEPK
jgi:hypothetical protein